MFINKPGLDAVFKGFNFAFNKGQKEAPVTWQKIAMKTTSQSREDAYGWLKQLPSIREWIGPRVVHNLASHGYTITNRGFEMTISVSRDDIEDDKYGVFGPLFEQMGHQTAAHPDELVYELLASGFTEHGYDGKPFFSEEHVIETENGGVTHSNMQDGDGPAWFLFDTAKPMKPLVYQERRPFNFVSKTAPNDPNVFDKNEYVYGVDGRSAAGFGLWQLAYASKAPLTHENYEAARAAMQSVRGEKGRKLGVVPNVLVVGTDLEGAALRVVKNGTRLITVGEAPDVTTQVIANEWADTAELVVSARL